MKRWHDLFSRRVFLHRKMQGSVALLLSGCQPGLLRSCGIDTNATKAATSDDFLRQFGPIDRTVPENVPAALSGDNFSRPHSILWNLDRYLAEKPLEGPLEEVPLVVIGGGVSGLFSAYTLRHHKPVVLEQAPRLGGNAKGQSWRGLDYSIGAAYIDLPEPGTPMHDFYHELALSDILTQRLSPDPIEYKGKLYGGFWEGETDPSEKAKYLALGTFLSNLNKEKERPFPFIPSLSPEHLASVRFYDQHDLHSLFSQLTGGTLPAQLETAIEYFCWSTYACSSKEISAAAALNFLAQEANPICVGAGGNARIAERLVERILREVPATNLRPSSLVVNVRVEGDHVIVLYENSEGRLKGIKARTAIMACPKFVAGRILKDIEEKRLATIKRLQYRSYMVANLLIRKPMPKSFYDVFMVGDGKVDLQDIRRSDKERNATDFVMANFASPNPNVNVFTFYRAFPYSGARAELMQENTYEIYRKSFEEQIRSSVLPLMQLNENDVADIRLTLWGHALPMSAKGLYSDDTVATLRAPFKERVFFIEQDNWAYPSLQTGATEIALQKADILKTLV